MKITFFERLDNALAYDMGWVGIFEAGCSSHVSCNWAWVNAEYRSALFLEDLSDCLSECHSSAEIREYFLEGLDVLEGANFSFNKVVRSGGDFYIDWTMRLDFKKTPSGTWEESIGMTRMRFNSDGQIIFHQDYWDPTDIVYKRIPIAKQLIAFVKSKM